MKNLQTGKTSPRVLKNTLYESLQLVLASENISKFYKWKAKTTFTTQQLISTYTEIYIYLNFPTKKPSTAARQSNHLILYWAPHLTVLSTV